MQPIFLFSLPRSGSTLLQRLLSQHVEISTEPEPWIAIPFFYALKAGGVNSVYGHKVLANAVNGFVDSFPNKRGDYNAIVAECLGKMYSLGLESGSRYFLDKTPRYHLIVDDLIEAFTNAKFIFLWRNPLAIASSMIQTWGRGRWNLYMFFVDLYQGLDSLVSAFNNNRELSISVKYEDLVAFPDKELARIMAYLQLENDGSILDAFSRAEKIEGRGRGDPTGQYKYRSISKGSRDYWKVIMGNPFRKAWARSYMEWIGDERLKIMGYDIHLYGKEIEEIHVNYKYLFSDLIRNFLGKIYCRYSIEGIRSNKAWRDDIYFAKN